MTTLRRIHSISLVVLLLPIISAQQYGSFFSVTYLNGAPLASNQVSCAGIGQPSYCCASGHSCAWDNSGQLACCPQGTTCTGNVGVVAGPYTQQAVQQTQVANNCGCTTSSTPAVNVLPVVPVAGTVITSTLPTSLQVSTTTTTTLVAGAVVTSNACPNGYSTVTEANVGTPTRVVGCYVIIDSGGDRQRSLLREGVFLIITLWILWSL